MKVTTILFVSLLATLSPKIVARGNTFLPRHFAVVANRPFTTSNNKDARRLPDATTKIVIDCRGGAGPIEPLAFAKWVTVLELINSSITYLIPEKINEAYGLSDSTPTMDLFQKMNGANLLGNSLLSYFLYWQSSSVETAVGVSLLPMAIEYLRQELAGEPETIGWTKYVNFIPISFSAITSYACFKNVAWCVTMQKVNAVWLALNALHWSIWPEPAGKTWGMELNDAETDALSWCGLIMASTAVYYGCLAWGMGALKALGFAWMPYTVGSGIKTILFPENFKESGTSRVKLWAWMALGAVASVTLAFGNDE